MSELKTLKDLEIHFSPYVRNIQTGKETRAEKSVKIKDLKQEAIKWVKEDIKEFGLFKDAIPAQTFRWIRRFDIKENDLK